MRNLRKAQWHPRSGGRRHGGAGEEKAHREAPFVLAPLSAFETERDGEGRNVGYEKKT